MVNPKAVVIDTNIYIGFLKTDPEIVQKLLTFDIIWVPSTVIGELAFGFNNSKKSNENFQTLENFLAQPQVFILDVDQAVALFFGKIKYQLKTVGRPIPTNDIWIAAAAMKKNINLMSRDRHFQEISELSLVIF